MTNPNNAAQAATQEAVRRALELYAECYDTMTRIAQREGREPVVSPVPVAADIRRNMVNAVVKALPKLRAQGVQASDGRANDLPDPHGCNKCRYAGCGRFNGPVRANAAPRPTMPALGITPWQAPL
ncbi:hypothetical protein [Achromobacter sp. UMC71]|uniref:hypothetical protein n=1 Tax=Achromobacter sp. UMC71 TaxID=1862320 RepID=UPI0015FEDFE4|nr:hypothetical protein [Achromobacter sp. UMC71]MBB1626580.1 hypothetical protein [Achromobacter sp. UMC71]